MTTIRKQVTIRSQVTKAPERNCWKPPVTGPFVKTAPRTPVGSLELPERNCWKPVPTGPLETTAATTPTPVGSLELPERNCWKPPAAGTFEKTADAFTSETQQVPGRGKASR